MQPNVLGYNESTRIGKPQMNPVPETPRLILREECLEDAESLFSYRQRPAYWQHIPCHPPTRDDVVAQIAHFLPQQSAHDRTMFFWVAIEKATCLVTGEASLWLLPDHGAEFAFAVDDRHWRKGYGSEIVRGILRFGFHSLRLHRLGAQVVPSNIASIALLRSLGMVEEGVLRERRRARGRWFDLAQFSMLEQEYARGASK